MSELYFISSDVYKEGVENNKIDEGSLYFLSDTKEIFRGTEVFGSVIEYYTEEEGLPTNPSSNKLYINRDTFDFYIYDSEWIPIKIQNSVISAIDIEDETNAVSGKAVADFIDSELNLHNESLFSHEELFDMKPDISYEFSVTLSADGWSEESLSQIAEDPGFITDGYTYIIEAEDVFASEIAVNGQMTFTCNEIPTEDIIVNILRIESSETGKLAEVLQPEETEVYLNKETPSVTLSIKRFGDAEITAVSSDETIATVVINDDRSITITALPTYGNCNIILSCPESRNYLEAKSTIIVSVDMARIYGVEWDGTSTTLWTRTDLSADFEDPIPYVAGATEYSSPFDNIYPWSGMVRVTDELGGELVAIPKFYYKWTQNGNGLKLQITNKHIDGFYVSPAHADRGDGYGERDVVYVGRYHCDTSYKSITAASPVVNITKETARKGIVALGEEYWQFDLAAIWSIRMLYLVEYANWNSQSTIGYGCGSAITGASDSMPYHTGTMAASRDSYHEGTQYRYIEGLWSLVCYWIDGCTRATDGSFYCSAKLSDYGISSNLVGSEIHVSGFNYITGYKICDTPGFEYLLLVSTVGGSQSTYISDQLLVANSSIHIASGSCSQSDISLAGGLFYSNVAQTKSGFVGCRLMKLPNPTTSTEE